VGVDRDGMVCTEMAFGAERLDRGTASAMRKLACKVGVELIEKMDAFLASAVAAGENEEENDDEDDRVMVVDVPNGQSTDMIV
jgi:exosome complex component RRP42